MKSRKAQHQGLLNKTEKALAERFTASPKRWFTSLDICKATGCISARDKVRKLQANGCPIGPAKFLHKGETGASVYGWRVAK